jgi:glycosyltransferase involved in cell wall biosynthesis
MPRRVTRSSLYRRGRDETLGRVEVRRLERSRKTWHDTENPLVTVTVATFNRSQLFIERTLPTILAQTHQHLEVVVVGDGCDDDNDALMRAVDDERVNWVNRRRRGRYPRDPERRWMVAGTTPINHALRLGRGLWYAHCDDDDEWTPEHLSLSLQAAREADLELVYSQMDKEFTTTTRRIIGRPGFNRGSVPHSTVVFRSYLRLFRLDRRSHRLGRAVDQDLWIRMASAGVRAGFSENLGAISRLRPATTDASYAAEDRQ